MIIFTLLIISSKASINCLNFSSVWNNDTPWNERYIDEANNVLWSNLILFFSIIRCVSRISRVSYQRNISMEYITCFISKEHINEVYHVFISAESLISIECFTSMECFNWVFLINGVIHFKSFISMQHITCLYFSTFHIKGASNFMWSDVFMFFKTVINQKLDIVYLSDGFWCWFLFSYIINKLGIIVIYALSITLMY